MNAVKWFSPTNANGSATLRQHAFVDDGEGGNEAVCGRLFLDDGNGGNIRMPYAQINAEKEGEWIQCANCLKKLNKCATLKPLHP